MAKSCEYLLTAAMLLLLLNGAANAGSSGHAVSDASIGEQRAILAINTGGFGFGPQSPRDIDSAAGNNSVTFEAAPAYTKMNLCNIHFHENAKHKGDEFAKYAGNGYVYSGKSSESELVPLDMVIVKNEHGDLVPGDTIEVHYVHSTAQITPGPSFDSCFSKAIMNPQLRVEAQVYVLVNDANALNFMDIVKIVVVDGLHQATNILSNTGVPVQYAGSTTGAEYN